MGPETSSQDTQPPAVALVAAPLARWPDELASRLSDAAPIAVDALADGTAEAEHLYVLGYGDPADGLAAALGGATEPDVATLLDDWCRAGEAMLRLRRSYPDRFLLVNLPRLDADGEAELLRRLGVAADGGEPAPPAATTPQAPQAAPPVELPAVLALYLSQRSDVAQLLADLEACADLLGREPDPLPAPAPRRGLPLAERLLHEWQADRNHRRQELERLRQERDQVQQERDQERQERERQQQELASLRSEQERLARELELSLVERRTIRGLLEDITGLQQQAEQEALQLRQELARCQEQLASQQAGTRQRIEELQGQIEAASAGRAELEGRLETSARQLEVSGRELDTLRTQARESAEQAGREVSGLRQEIERVQEREESERMEALRIQNELEGQLAASQLHIEEARGQLEQVRSQLEEARGQLEDRERLLEERIRQLQERDRQLQEAARELGAVRQELHNHQEAQQAEQAEARRVRGDLEGQLAEARLQLEEARGRSEAAASAERQVQESAARLEEAEEERELILLQLKQVQDELSHHFQEHQQARRELEELGQRHRDLQQRLEGLEEESRYLFLHSRLNADIDRSRIAGILGTMRQTLRA